MSFFPALHLPCLRVSVLHAVCLITVSHWEGYLSSLFSSAGGLLVHAVSYEVSEVGCSRCVSAFSLLILGRVKGVEYGIVIIAVS